MNSAICPYCRGSIEPDEPQTVHCPGCGTPHHADCFEENGGCTVFGCSAAPAAEPKLSIGAPDLQGASVTGATIQTVAATVTPPPPPAGSAAPPPPPPVREHVGIASAESAESRPMFSSLGYGNPNLIAQPSIRPIQMPWPIEIDPSLPRKSRTTYLLLGVLLGAFGAHSFYAGSTKKGFLQLGITVLTLGTAGIMVWIWAVIDICTISEDNDGIPFRN